MADANSPSSGSDGERLQNINIEDEMRASYLDYAMSVIIGRALPDVRDGLKPVHRRVLFAMHELGNTYNRAYKKSARIVGDVIGKYHPHGDQAIYDTLVRMAQTFSMRHVLIDGQGNFGSVDGDSPAAMRYTEVRMAKLAAEMLADLDKETVDLGSNYDDTLQEPLVLPARFPNLLVNGSSGIAVGMATNIPPHNLREVINATVALARNSELTVRDLMKLAPGPDFPTGGMIYGTAALKQAYETGRGVIRVRGRTHVEEMKNDRERIVITEIPYQLNKTSLLEKIADLVRDKRIEGISDIRDESDREGMRVVIELKRDVSADVILNQLYSLTPLQSSFGLNMLAIVNGRPATLSLKEILQHFLDHRHDVVTRRSRYELREAQRRFNIVFGLLAAIDSIDRIIVIVRGAQNQDDAKTQLMAERLQISPAFKALCTRLLTFPYAEGHSALAAGFVQLNDRQAQAILDMRLARLTGLERDKLSEEADELRQTIERLTAILNSKSLLLEVIIEELEAIKTAYGEDRRTELVHDAREMSIEDLIAEESMVVTVSHAGYVKRASIDLYRAQKRGGRGKTAATTRDEDFVSDVFVASTHSDVLVFTDLGKVYWLKVHEIPQAGRASRGKPIVNLIRLAEGEQVAALLPIREFTEGRFLVMTTAKGYIKKTDLMAFSHPRPSGLIALTIDEGDRLIHVGLTDGNRDILIATRQALAIRFHEDEVRAMGRTARGVRAINFKKDGDEVVGMVILDENVTEVLTISTRGLGKRSQIDEYRVQGRSGSGIINCKLPEGEVAGVLGVNKDDEIMIVTDRGMMIRTEAGQISVVGRASQGVRLISLEDGESVASITRIAERDTEKLEGALPAADGGDAELDEDGSDDDTDLVLDDETDVTPDDDA